MLDVGLAPLRGVLQLIDQFFDEIALMRLECLNFHSEGDEFGRWLRRLRIGWRGPF